MAKRTGRVGIVGLGYVGLSTAVSFASRGIATVGIDVDEGKLARIANGEPPFVEKGLPELLGKALRHRRLMVTSDCDALAGAGVVFVTVGTPSADDGSIDLSCIRNATSSVGRMLRRSEGYSLIVVKSTVIPGTADDLVMPVLMSESRRKQADFGLASNPEFLREGHAIEDTMHPDRLVIGVEDKKSERTLVSFYRGFYGRLPKILLTTPVNAELIKYASNSFLATKISFINDIARLCNSIPGADIRVVAEGMGLDKRIAPGFLSAGLGYGGSCFGKDIKALLSFAQSKGVELRIPRAAHETNERQPLLALEVARKHLGDLSGKRIAILGLSFKPGTDDMREAVSVVLINGLLKAGASVVAYDPVAIENARKILGSEVSYSKSAASSIQGADCCILATEWEEFKRLRPKNFAKMNRPFLIDGRRVYDPAVFRGKLEFEAVGLGTESPR
ncbi:MAG: UDP-glucose/GDP-mannose dehydrogenase family protein [Nitrososphaerales archaeon]|nr:UDP-glucose/GDP-mannose dehydrogenase family protein [Nitrososphaerales archaeon]